MTISAVVLLALASVLIPVGLLKLVRGKALAGSRGMLWMHDFSSPAISAIGLAEVIAGGAMIAGALVPSRPAAVAGAVVALVVLSGAVYTHFRRKELGAMVPPAMLAVGTLIVMVLL